MARKSMISRYLILLILVFSLLQCNNTGENKKNDISGLLLLLAAQSTMNAKPDTTCPPKSLPSDILIATAVVYGQSTVSGFDDSSKAINGICGEGESAGSLDVYALNLTGSSATLKLSWDGKSVKNVSGNDFIVYENAFKVSETSDRYALDPMVVGVSIDDTTYCGFTLTHDSTSSTLNKLTSWQGFGGLRPVIYNMGSKIFTLTELFTSTGNGFLMGGGDGFDLENLITSASCLSDIRDQIKASGFKFIRMTSASAVTNPLTSTPYTYPHSFNNGSDIDGVVGKLVE